MYSIFWLPLTIIKILTRSENVIIYTNSPHWRDIGKLADYQTKSIYCSTESILPSSFVLFTTFQFQTNDSKLNETKMLLQFDILLQRQIIRLYTYKIFRPILTKKKPSTNRGLTSLIIHLFIDTTWFKVSFTLTWVAMETLSVITSTVFLPSTSWRISPIFYWNSNLKQFKEWLSHEFI